MAVRKQRERRRKPERGKWASTILGAGLLVAMGFLLGIAAGAVWEERDLIANHIFGIGEEIQLAESEALSAPGKEERAPLGIAGGAVARRVEVASPLKVNPESTAAQSSAQVAAKSGRSAKLPPVSSPPPAGKFEIQVGAFLQAAPAQQLTAELRSKGYFVDLSKQQPEAGTAGRWRVRVGPIATRVEAEFLAAKLKREEKLPTWILRVESS